MEDLLTEDEIQQILQESQKPEYNDPFMLHFGRSKTSIFKKSLKTGLILVYGNQDTGYEHIFQRHSQSSRKPYWKDSKLGKPTKFSVGLAPIEYIDLADEIYKSTNINKAKNKRPDQFDVYIGKSDTDGFEYTLVLYTKTKIIHSLFLSKNSKPYNLKNELNLRRGWTSATEFILHQVQQFTIPYFDENNIQRLALILRVDINKKQEQWYAQIHNNDGYPFQTHFLSEKKIESYIDIPFRRSSLDFEDLSQIEKKARSLIDAD